MLLPPLGTHLSMHSRAYKKNEWFAAPFPKAETVEEVLHIANEVESQGYVIIAPQQRPIKLRLPTKGESGEIIGETTDNLSPAKYSYFLRNAATGTTGSKLWFGDLNYPFFGSMEALKQFWAKNKVEMERNKVLVAEANRKRNAT